MPIFRVTLLPLDGDKEWQSLVKMEITFRARNGEEANKTINSYIKAGMLHAEIDETLEVIG